MAVQVANSADGGNVLVGFLLGAVMVAVSLVGLFTWDKTHTGTPAPATITDSEN